jgi:hypothetical protein
MGRSEEAQLNAVINALATQFSGYLFRGVSPTLLLVDPQL